MCVAHFDLVALAIIILSLIENDATDTRRHSILKLQTNNKPSVIAILYPNEQKVKEIHIDEKFDIDISKDITPEIESLEPPYDRKAYLLYHVLRTAEDREEIDPEAARTLDKTKDILRQALRVRCNKLKSCVRKCPQKKKYITCTIKCQETHDDYNVCKKKKCSKPKCGQTMPPSWLRN